ncbi:7-deoxyloganetin glucosyltransferase-like [Rosa rugosa]|uniref:7-deoxyloganetin glucosyltransferase-like n=1 Tax=Rosa rugosa TaxID=74645 RepID=UPI002B4079F1|nr:7-deoxyloganetin glucosyltransferase-like [Rosa rugosa]
MASAYHHKPHAVCIPVPAQSHIKAMLKLTKILHHRGFHITFVNTEFNHKRFLKSRGPNSLDGLPDFHFEAIPDGIPESGEDATQDGTLIFDSIRNHLLAPFRDLLIKLNSTSPPVTCIVSDGFMSAFTITAAEELGIPIALFYTISACSFMGLRKFRTLLEKGLAPLKDETCVTNGFLDNVIEWIPEKKDIRLRDLPSFCRTTDPDDIMFKTSMEAVENANKASAVVLLTFDALEKDVLEALSSSIPPPVYTIGPLQLLLNQIPEDPLKPMGYSLWKEETDCLQWLNCKAPNSIVYVNFGSITVLTPEQLLEFGWGLANTRLPFLWVIRPDLVAGKSAILPPEFEAETKDRGLIASWCPQEEVLHHPSVGGFLTHCGWNSTIESVTAGMPMLCWPFFADQQTNSYYSCNEWGIGMEIKTDVKRDNVEKLVKELMEGDKGKKMKSKALEWKKLAEEATAPYGSSSTNLDNLVNQVLLRKRI